MHIRVLREFFEWVSNLFSGGDYAAEAEKATSGIINFVRISNFISKIIDVISYDFFVFLIFVAFFSISTFLLFRARLIIIDRSKKKATDNLFLRSFTLIFILAWIVLNISLAIFWINENSTKYESKYWSNKFFEAKKSIENFDFEKTVFDEMIKDEFKQRYDFLKDCISNFRSDPTFPENYKNLFEDKALEKMAKGEASEKLIFEFAEAMIGKEFYQDCLKRYELKANF